MGKHDLIDDLLAFLQASPTPFHAVADMSRRLEQAGFTELNEADAWQLKSHSGYYLTRAGSSIIAFRTGAQAAVDAGIRMIGAHTDSPCLKVKPLPEMRRQGYFQLGMEVYGGALLHPWFDRDLSLAGRVTVSNSKGKLRHELIDFARPVAVIPSLAIHLNREANNSSSVNAQQDLPAILMQAKDDTPDFETLLLQQLKRQQCKGAKQVQGFDLYCYDTQPPARVGLEQEFFTSARLDNLLSCYVGLHSLLDSSADQPALLVCNDHEEVGSQSAIGAQGPFLKSTLLRWLGHEERLVRSMSRSMLISVDNAHGIHPNFADKHDSNHGPRLNAGPVIKINSNQRYASSGETVAIFKHLCAQADVPLQQFVVRSDMACGSTIGPLTAGLIGVKTLDLGVPQFAMHSIREMAGCADVTALHQGLSAFLQTHTLWH